MEVGMYCVKCGNQLDDSAKFCSSCGQKVGGNVKGMTISFPEEDVKNVCQTAKKKCLEVVEKYACKKKINIFSLVCMLIAIALCFSSWFYLPRMGSYAPLEWYRFINSCSYYLSSKVYDRATIVPGISIWVNIPLVLCIINAIFIWREGKGKIALSLACIISLILIFIYAQVFFSFYDSYVLAGGTGSSLQSSFYLMVVVVFVEMLKNVSDKGKSVKDEN